MTTTATAGERTGAGPLTGTARLVRLALRRDRVLLPVWTAVIVVLVIASVASIVGLYATEAARLRYATVAATSAVARAFDGPMSGSSLGAVTMTETFGFLAVLLGIMSVQTVTRHTRQEEETGRAELVGSGIVGRHAPLVAALAVAVAANVVIAAAVMAALIGYGLPAVGSLAAAVALAGAGSSFAGMAAVTAQVASTQRAANGLGIAAVGVTFLLRAVGDAFGTVAGSGVEVISAWPSWLSPIGWGQQVRPYADERWAVLGLFVGLVALLVAVAFFLRSHRDAGTGLVAVRRGAPAASSMLRSPLGLAWRLQRGAVLGWAAGLCVLALAFGAIGEEAGEIIATSEELAAMLAQLGDAGLTDLFFAFFMGILAIAAAGFTVQSLLRARNEEADGRAEPLLAGAVSRARWLLSHVVVAGISTLGILSLAGLTAGLSYAAVTGSGEQIGPLLTAGLVQASAALALGGLVVTLIGAFPRGVAAAGWGALVASLVMGQLGALLDLPQVLLNLSPFTHVPAVPAEDLAWLPVVVLLGLAVTLTALGVGAFRRRDLSTS